jgi:hypothetical protein
MQSRYRQNIALSKARLDDEMMRCAKKICHHPFEEFALAMQQRFSNAIAREYLRELYDSARG